MKHVQHMVQSIQLSNIHTVSIHHVCRDIGRHVCYGSFSSNIESQRTLSVRYFTTLSQQMLTAFKHITDDNLFSAEQRT